MSSGQFRRNVLFSLVDTKKTHQKTPIGYVMTEFLVNRSYADKYNMISCALGHHIYESRWLHEPQYLDQYVHAWYRGNEGKPWKICEIQFMDSRCLIQSFLVNNDRNFLLDMLPDLDEEYRSWENDHRLENGLFWQEDVRDGMEESISGGRRKNMPDQPSTVTCMEMPMHFQKCMP